MGYWDCRYCGTTDIPGSDRECPHCGRPRDNNVVFHPNQNGRPSAPRQYVTDPVEADRLRHTPDWHCSFCDSLNSGSKNTCPSCGHTREESDRNYFQLHPERRDDHYESRPREPETPKDDDDYHSSWSNFVPISAPPEKRFKSWSLPSLPSINIPWKWIGIALLIVALIVAAVFILIPKERYITVTDIAWQRGIEVEEYRTVRESDWYVPAGGRTQYTQQEIHHYDTVLDHYDTVTKSRTVVTGSHTEYSTRDLGNGYFEEVPHTVYEYGTEYYTEQEPVYRQDPVYRTKYYYDIERWVYDHTVTSSAHDKSPYWPEVTLKDNQRQGAKHQKYIVTAVYDEKSADYTMDYGEWEAVSIGDELHVLVHITGYIELIHEKEE